MKRRRAEEAFAWRQDCVIVATSTLALGIDVGDLDRVIQIDAPVAVASFLQRLGRTGRRAGTTRNYLFLTTTPESLMQAAALVKPWGGGHVERFHGCVGSLTRCATPIHLDSDAQESRIAWIPSRVPFEPALESSTALGKA